MNETLTRLPVGHSIAAAPLVPVIQQTGSWRGAGCFMHELPERVVENASAAAQSASTVSAPSR
ncbi:TPA: hypothetical protein UMB92_001474 [Stenotrophomonas maltophilia]|nr:hypothetical protein [Stenotrophomonas maltophilia]